MKYRLSLVATGLGIVAVIFLWPVSILAAVAAFVLIQILYEISFGRGEKRFKPDRFREGLRTAKKVLDEMG